jgi:hypothetical protein
MQQGVTPRESGGYVWFEAYVGSRLQEGRPEPVPSDGCALAGQYAPGNAAGWVAIPVAVGERDLSAASPDVVPRFKTSADAMNFFAAAKRYLVLGTPCGNRHFLPVPDIASLFAVGDDARLAVPAFVSATSVPAWKTIGEAIEMLGQIDDEALARHRGRRPQYVGVGVGGPGRIVGRVRDPSGGVIPGTYVDAWPRNGGARVRSTTHEDGSYEVDNLPSGWYRVIAHITGFVKSVHEYVWVGGRRTIDATLPVAGMCDCIVSTATDKATLEVRVTDSFGRPWPEAAVMLDETRRGVWPTSDDGRIVFGELDPGQFTVRVAAAGFAVVTRPVQLKARATERLNIGLQPFGPEPLAVVNAETTRRFRVETNLGELSVDFDADTSETMRDFVTDVAAGVFDARILNQGDDKAIVLNPQRHFGRTWTWQVESSAITFATTAAPADRIIGRIVRGPDVASSIRRLQIVEPPSYARRVAILAISAIR